MLCKLLRRRACEQASAEAEPLCRAQQDITRGRDMVDSLFQGKTVGIGGTHNSVLSSTDYLSNAARTLNNIEDGFYISPSFLDKLSIHVAKNFLDLPKIKVPLILGARPAPAPRLQAVHSKVPLS